MSENPITTFDLVDANTMEGINSLGDASARSFKPTFNGPGSFSFTLPLDSQAAYAVRKRATGVLIIRDTRPIWSGGITNVAKSAAANTMQVTATGWLEEFDHRYVRKNEESTLHFVNAIGGSIAKTLVQTCNAQTDISLIERPLRTTFAGTIGDTQVRTRAYHVGDNYGASIRELTTIENGFDLSIDPLSRVMSTMDPAAFTDRKDVRFGWGVEPFNLSDVAETTDGTNLFNRENAITSGGIVTSADDAQAIDDAGVMLEEWVSLSDVSNTAIATAFANAELVVKRYGLITYQLTPNSFGNLPRPYDDFQWGDQAYFSVDCGALRVEDQAVRLFAGTINYTDEGDEVLAELEVAMSS